MVQEEIVRSIVVHGVANSTTSFLSNQTDVDLKQERLNELLIEINSAIEFAKAHELILNSSLREWLDDLQKASKEGAEVQIAFREHSKNTKSINPWKVFVRLYQRSKRVNRLNAAVTRLQRKASNCEKFRQMLRDEINKQRDQTYTERVEKLERKVARLRNSLKTIRSNGMFKKRKNTKHTHGPRRGHHNAIIISEPDFGDQNHAEPEKKEDSSSEQEIQEIQQQIPHERITTVLASCEWEEMNSSPPHTMTSSSARPRTMTFSSARRTKKAAEAKYEFPAEPVHTPERDAYRNDTLFLSSPAERLAVPEFGEWGDTNSSPVVDYTMYFEKCKMGKKKDAAKANPIQIPAEPVRTPERNAYRSNMSFLSRLFACISLNTRN